MSGQENRLNNQEPERPIFTEARRLEMMRSRAINGIRQCQRKGLQLREMLIKSFEGREKSNPQAEAVYSKALEMISRMPDYDLTEPAGFADAKKDLTDILLLFVDIDTDAQDLQEQSLQSEWTRVGVLAYEFGEEGKIFLHVPPMEGKPGLHQLKDSLSQIADFLKRNPDIHTVCGSSLLLEHPIAKRLGFEIDESDENKGTKFKISREEFLARWGK